MIVNTNPGQVENFSDINESPSNSKRYSQAPCTLNKTSPLNSESSKMNAEFQKFLQTRASEFAKESMKHKGLRTHHSDEINEAVKLWTSDWVKEEEKKIFMDFDKEYVHPHDKVVDAFVKKVAKYSHNIQESEENEFEYLVEFVGFERFAWFKQIWYKLEKFDKKHYEEAFDLYQNHIYYKDNGRIDYEKIITEFYESKKFPSEFTKFFELSTFAFEKKLKEWFESADKKVLDSIYQVIKERCKAFGLDDTKVEYEYDYYLPAYWYYRFAHKTATVPFDDLISEFGGKFTHPYFDKKSTEKNMIFVSAFFGHYHAFKYFWEYLDDNTKTEYLTKAVAHTFDYEHGFNFYGSKFEIAEALFTSMATANYWMEFLQAVKKGEVPIIFMAIVSSWPWSYIWFPSFDSILPFVPKVRDLSDDAKDYAFHGLVEFYKNEWTHHDWTHFALLIKEFTEKIFEHAGYSVQ